MASFAVVFGPAVGAGRSAVLCFAAFGLVVSLMLFWRCRVRIEQGSNAYVLSQGLFGLIKTRGEARDIRVRCSTVGSFTLEMKCGTTTIPIGVYATREELREAQERVLKKLELPADVIEYT